MPPGMVDRPDHPQGTHRSRDFGRLWFGRAVSDLGSAVGSVALPLVAVLVLDASALQVSLLVALSAVAGAALAVPLGVVVEYRRKRPTMILADVVRAGLLTSVPVAAGLGVLSFTHLCAVAMLNAGLTVVFGAASQAHLRALVARGSLGEANGRLESTLWLAVSVGPALGGALAGLVGAVWALLADAVSFCVSAVAVARIRRPEPRPPARATGSRRADLGAGWHFLLGHPTLRRCLVSYAVFSGTVMLLSPLETVFLLRTLDAQPGQYGLVVGVPCLAGLAGARLAPRLMRRLGVIRALWWTSLARGPWMLLFPLATPGYGGLVLCAAALAGSLGFSAVSNTALTTYRQLHTPEHLVARATTAWSVTIRTVQPVFVVLGGLLAAQAGVRAAIWAGVAALTLSAFALPRRAPDVAVAPAVPVTGPDPVTGAAPVTTADPTTGSNPTTGADPTAGVEPLTGSDPTVGTRPYGWRSTAACEHRAARVPDAAGGGVGEHPVPDPGGRAR